jgi:hypothetical protein
MRRSQWALFGIAVSAALLTGCVERRYVIETDPPGAIVYRNGKELGASPVDDHFVYYGKYDFTIKKDGYQTQQIPQEIPAPWYQWFPLDFVTEVLVPVQLEDVRHFRYVLLPAEQPRIDDLLRESENLRNRGHNLPPPPGGYSPPAPPAVVPPTPPGPPPLQGRQIGPQRSDGPNPAPATGATLPAPRRLPPE